MKQSELINTTKSLLSGDKGFQMKDFKKDLKVLLDFVKDKQLSTQNLNHFRHREKVKKMLE